MTTATTSKATLIAKLQKEFPNIKGICDGKDRGWGDCIHLGDAAEGGTIDDMPACNYYGFDLDPQETIWVMGVHKKLRDFIEARGWFIECNDPGTYLAYRQ